MIPYALGDLQLAKSFTKDESELEAIDDLVEDLKSKLRPHAKVQSFAGGFELTHRKQQ